MCQYYYEILMNTYCKGDIEKLRKDLKNILTSGVIDNVEMEKLISKYPGVVLECMEELSPEDMKTLKGATSPEEFKDRFEDIFRKHPSIARKLIKDAEGSLKEDED